MGKTETIFSTVRNETRVSTFSTLIQYILEFLARGVRQEEETKRIQIGQEETKLFLFEGDMILYLKDPENSTKNLDTINTFSKVAGFKINFKNQ
jgi:hypothetical protein